MHDSLPTRNQCPTDMLTVACSIMSDTLTSPTPGTLASCPSSAATHDAHVMPVTRKCAVRMMGGSGGSSGGGAAAAGAEGAGEVPAAASTTLLLKRRPRAISPPAKAVEVAGGVVPGVEVVEVEAGSAPAEPATA